MNRRDFLKLGGITAAGLALTPFIGSMKSVNALSSPSSPPPTRLFFGLSKEEWTERWWQWAYSVNKKQNPVLDETGAFVQKYQPEHEPVVFLAGGYEDEKLEREITVSSKKGLIIPPICCSWSYAELPKSNTPQDLIYACSLDMSHVTVASLELDSKPVGLERIMTEPFYIQMEKQNYFPEDIELPQHRLHKDGITTAISDGLWGFLEPLPVGKHIIHSKGSTRNSFTKDYDNEVIYKITSKA